MATEPKKTKETRYRVKYNVSFEYSKMDDLDNPNKPADINDGGVYHNVTELGKLAFEQVLAEIPLRLNELGIGNSLLKGRITPEEVEILQAIPRKQDVLGGMKK